MIKEMRLRKKKDVKVQNQTDKKKSQIVELADKRKAKLVTMVAKGNCLIGAVFHVNSSDNTGEFDAFFIERIKNCLHLMIEKDFIAQLDQEIYQ